MGENKPKDKSGSKLGLPAAVPSRPAVASPNASSIVLPSENVALKYAMTGDVEKLVQCFTDTADPNYESIGIQISERSCDDGRSPLDWAAILGHADMISELLKRGVDVNAVNEKGYTAAHFAAAWGQVNCLRLLGNNGANLLLKNIHEETPRDVAKRYAQRSCIEYIDWADAKRSLKDCVLAVKDQLAATDKLKALTKDEKTGINSMINEQLGWLERVTDEATMDDFITQKQIFDDYALPIISKLSIAESDTKLRPKSQKKAK